MRVYLLAGRFLSNQVPRFWWRVGGIAVLSAVGGFVDATVVLVVVRAGLSLATGRPPSSESLPLPWFLAGGSVFGLLVGGLALVVVRLGLQVATAFFEAQLSARVLASIRGGLIDAYLESGWPAQSSRREGYLEDLLFVKAYRGSFGAFLLVSAAAATSNLVILLIATVVVLPPAAGVAGVAVALLVGALMPVRAALRSQSAIRNGAEAEFASKVGEASRVVKSIDVFGVGRTSASRLRQSMQASLRAERRVRFLEAGTSGAFQSVAMAIVLIGLMALERTATAQFDQLGAVVLLLLRAFSFAQQAQHGLNGMAEAVPTLVALAAEVGGTTLHGVNEEGPGRLDIANIDLTRVSFAYNGKPTILAGVTAMFSKPSLVGVVGPSGAGKSTLMELVLALRSPTEGSVRVGECEIQELPPHLWAAETGYVPQDADIIEGTIAENIRFFRPNLLDADIIAAAKAAGIHDEITALGDGYQTVIGARAQTMSGGQRQRIAIARALAARPQLLVLDEPTSALDAASEDKILTALADLRNHTLTFLVTHRLSMLRECNWIMKVQDGRVEVRAGGTFEFEKSNFSEQTTDPRPFIESGPRTHAGPRASDS